MIIRRAVLATMLLGAAACGDARLRKLSENIPRDSAMKLLLDEGAAPDSSPHIYREARYLVDGRFYRIAYYTKTDRKEATDTLEKVEPLLDDELSPLVFVNDTLTGWGWDHWEDVAASIKVPVPPRR